MGVRPGPHSAWYGNSLNRAPERSRPNARAAPFTKDSPRCGNLSIDSRAPQVLASIAKDIGYSSYPPGDRKTTVKDRKKEIGKGLLAKMLGDLGIEKDDF